MDLSREDKLELAKKRLSQFQKKRKPAIKAKEEPQLLHSPEEPVLDGQDQHIRKDEDENISTEISPIPSPSSPNLAHSNLALNDDSVLLSPQVQTYVTWLYRQDFSFDHRTKPDRASKSMLEHVDYIERLNGMLTKENKSLAESLKQLKEQLALAQNENAAVQRNHAAFNAQLAALGKENSALKGKLDSFQQQLSSIPTLESTLSDTKRQLEESQNMLAAAHDTEEKNRDYQRVIETLRQKNYSLQEELEKSKEKEVSARDFENQVKSLKSALVQQEEAFEVEKMTLEGKIDDFKNEMSLKIAENEKLRIETEEKRRQLNQLTSGLQNESKERLQLKSNVESLQSERNQLKEELNAIKLLLSSKDEELGKLRNLIPKKEEDLEKDHTILSLQNELQKINTDFDQLKQIVVQKNQNLENSRTELDNLKSQLKDKNDNFEKKEHEIENLNKLNENLKIDIITLNKNKQEVEGEIVKFKAQLEDSAKNALLKEAELESQKKANENLQQDFKVSLEKSERRFQEEVDQLKSQLKDSATNIASKEIEAEKFRLLIDQLQQDLKLSLKDCQKEFQDEVDRLKLQFEQSSRDSASKNAELDKLRMLNEKLQHDLKFSLENSSKSHQEALLQKEKDVHLIGQQLERQKEENIRLRQTIESSNSDFKKREADLLSAIQGKVSENETISTEIGVLKDKIDGFGQLKSSHEQLRHDYENLAPQLSQVKEFAEGKLRELEECHLDLRKHREELEAFKTQVATLSKEKEETQNLNNVLQVKIKNKEDQLEKIMSHTSATTQEYQKLSETSQKYENELLRLQSELTNVQKEKATQEMVSKDMEYRLESLQANYNQAEEEYDQLKSKYDFLALENTSLKQSYEETAAASSSILKEKETLLQTFQNDLETQRIKYNELQLMLEQYETNRVEITKHKDEEIYKYQEIIAQMKEEIQMLNIQLSDTSNLESLQSSMEQIKLKLEETVSQLTMTKKESQEKTEVISHLEQQLHTFEQSFNLEKDTVNTLKTNTLELQETVKNSRILLDETQFFLAELETSKEYTFENFKSTSNHNYLISKIISVLKNMNKEIGQMKKKEFDTIHSEITSRYHDVQIKNTHLSVEYEDMQRKMNEVSIQKTILEEQITTLKKSLKSQLESNEEFSQKFKAMNAEKTTFESIQVKALEDLQDQNKKLKSQLSKERENVKSLNAKISEMSLKHETILQNFGREKESAAASVDMIEGLLADEREQNMLLKSKLEKLAQSGSTKTNENLIEKEKDDLKQMLNSATDELETSITNIKNLKDQLQNTRSDFEKLKREYDDASQISKLIAKKYQIDRPWEKLSDLLHIIVLLEDQPAMSPTHISLERSIKAMDSFLVENETIEEKPGYPQYNTDLNAKLESANKKVDELTKQLENSSARYQDHINSQMRKISELGDELEVLKLKAESGNLQVAEKDLIHTHRDNEDVAEFNDISNSLRLKNDEIHTLRERIEEFELSLSHAEKTISTLTMELDRRQDEINKLVSERDSFLTQNQIDHTIFFDKESRIMDKKVEDAMFKAGETVEVIDELVRLAKQKSFASFNNERSIKQSNPRENSFQKIIDILEIELKKKSHDAMTIAHLKQIVDLLLVLQKESLSVIKERELVQLRKTDEEEIQQLRFALNKATEMSAYAETGDAGSATISLLQSHVRQLRKVWEHETNANNVLRKVISEIRLRVEKMEDENSLNSSKLQKEIDDLTNQLEINQTNTASTLGLQSENSILKSELGSIKERLEYFDKENLRLRTELQQTEFSWRKEKNQLLDQLHSEKINALSFRHDSDFSNKISELKRNHSTELNDTRKRFRDEKQQLLDRFRQKISEFENVHKLQQEMIAKLKKEKGHPVIYSNNSDIHDEISQLRKEKKRLCDALERERNMNDSKLKIQNHEKEELFKSVKNIEKSFSQSADSQDVFSAALKREQSKHQAHCKKLVNDIVVLKVRYKREAGYRADLIYQKNYLLLLMGGLEACEKLALSLVYRMGFPPHSNEPSPRTRLRKVFTSVLFITRVK